MSTEANSNESSAVAVSVFGLWKRYGDTEAICGVSFEVKAGQVFGLLGPNGAGKTTTLECILGLGQPDSGSIHIARRHELHANFCCEASQPTGAFLHAPFFRDIVAEKNHALLLAGGRLTPGVQAVFRTPEKERAAAEQKIADDYHVATVTADWNGSYLRQRLPVQTRSPSCLHQHGRRDEAGDRSSSV